MCVRDAAWDHGKIINQIDAAEGFIELVVAARKLTEANVFAQHIGQVPCEIRV